jgi:glyoxylase-like metal-dependent hydrolase (beta-lactamase superfamily II)
LANVLADADEVAIVVTHGHGDHTEAAPALAAEIGAEVLGPEGLDVVGRVLRDGDVVETDDGPLVAVHTPGHTVEHLSFHWPKRQALFAGDMVLGEGDTTWVAEYPGCVAEYLSSIERLRALRLAVMYPAHGLPLTDPDEALDRYERHRMSRVRQVETAMSAHPGADLEKLLDIVYGVTLPSAVRGAARMSLGALVEYVRGS